MIDLKKAQKLWKSGLSTLAIANILGVTKGQLSGRIGRNRHLFESRESPIKRAMADVSGVLLEPKKPKEKTQRKPEAKVTEKLFEAKPTSLLSPEEYDQSRLPGYTLWELDARGCKYPLLETQKGETQMFCGETRYQMKPWCKAHHERVWRAQ